MVDITPAIPGNRNMVDAYGDHGFRVSGQKLEGAILLGLSQSTSWQNPGLDADNLKALLAQVQILDEPVSFLLIGAGERASFIPHEYRQTFRDAGISLDVMNTGAACRTFNILMTEERQAAAALLPVA